MSVFADNIFLYIENPNSSTKNKNKTKTPQKLSELINLVKLQDIKINIKKSILFLYTNNKVSERDINREC